MVLRNAAGLNGELAQGLGGNFAWVIGVKDDAEAVVDGIHRAGLKITRLLNTDQKAI
jgi:hypothetical protein